MYGHGRAVGVERVCEARRGEAGALKGSSISAASWPSAARAWPPCRLSEPRLRARAEEGQKLGRLGGGEEEEREGRTHPHGHEVRLLQVDPRLCARLDECAPEALGELLAVPRLDLALVDPVDLVADEDDGHAVAVLDARDLVPEALDAVERGARGRRVDDQEALAFSAGGRASKKGQRLARR